MPSMSIPPVDQARSSSPPPGLAPGFLIGEPLVRGFAQGFEPDANMLISEWADEYRFLPQESSAEYGKFRMKRTPYLKEILDCLSPQSPVKEVCFVKPTQIGGTDGVGNNFLLYTAHKRPRPCMMVLPTIDLARRHSKSKIDPSVGAMDCMRGLIRDSSGSKKHGDSVLIKEFPGGFWMFLGSNSSAALRSASICNLILDDVDGFEMEVGDEGDPIEIIKKRTDSFSAISKILYISTPTTTETSRIWVIFTGTDQSYFYVPCRLCGHEQRLLFGGKDADFGLKWEGEDPSTAKYLCAHCHQLLPETHKTWMLEHGRWIPTHPEIKLFRGFQLSSLYSPYGWVSWTKIVHEWLKCHKDTRRRKVFVNTRLGEPFEEKGVQPAWAQLKAGADAYAPWTAPIGVGLITAGVDKQANRLACVIRGWGRGEESWLIHWTEIFGDTSTPDPWNQLEALMSRYVQHAYGFQMSITCVAIDSGDDTHTVYNFVRQRSTKYMATKGRSTTGHPIIGRPSKQDVNYQGTVIANGVELWPIGTDTAKHTIYSRLEATCASQVPGPGTYHFPMDIPDDYYRQLTSEKHITKYKRDGFSQKEWFLPSGRRNEALDCEVLALAAAIKTGLLHINWDTLYYNQKARQEVLTTGKQTEYPQAHAHAQAPTHPQAPTRRRVSSRYMNR